MIKRVLPFLLMILLVLSGCDGQPNTGESLDDVLGYDDDDLVVEVDPADLVDDDDDDFEEEEDEEPEVILDPVEMTLEEAQALLIPGEDGVVAITSSDHLVALSVLVASGDTDHYGTTFQMKNNIRLEGMAFIPIGGGSGQEIPQFGGTFDGGNHIVSSVTIYAENESGTGLFGLVDEGGRVENLHLTGVSIKGLDNTGGIAGYCKGSIYNCSVAGEITSTGIGVGAVCGTLEGAGASISASFSNAQVSGNYMVGGLVGGVYEGSVSDCFALGSVYAIDSDRRDASPGQVGGFIGRQDGGTVTRCYASTEVYTRVSSQIVGGFIGYNNGSPQSCYYNYPATENWQVIDANLDNQEYDITGCTAGELTEPDTFEGWDFTHMWGLEEGMNRNMPYLRAAWEDEESDDDGEELEELGLPDESEPFQEPDEMELDEEAPAGEPGEGE